MAEEIINIEPIYKTSDGQIVTHSQLLQNYDEGRIKKGLSNGILKQVGDTKDANQQYVVNGGELATTQDLLKTYSQDKIDKGVRDGILIPHFEDTDPEKKNILPKPLPTPLDNGLSSGEKGFANGQKINPFEVSGMNQPSALTPDFKPVNRGLYTPTKAVKSVDDVSGMAKLPNGKSVFKDPYLEKIIKAKKTDAITQGLGETGEQKNEKQVQIIEAPKRAVKKKEDTDKAIENTTLKVLKSKGISASVGSAQYNEEKNKIQKAVENNDAALHYDKSFNPILKRTTGWFESFKNKWNESMQATDDAHNFINDMSTEDKVAYANKQLKSFDETDKKDFPYEGSTASDWGSVGGFLGENAPFLVKAAEGTLAGAAAVAAAPESLGASLAGLPVAASFLATAPDMINQSAMQEVLRRYHYLKKENPNVSDTENMAKAEEGKWIGGAAGLVTNTLLMGGGGALEAPISEAGKNVLGNFMKRSTKSALTMGGTVAAVDAAKEVEGIAEGYKVTPQEVLDHTIESFKHNATVGFLLHTMVSEVPNLVKSAAKFAITKSIPIDKIKEDLQVKEDNGLMPKGTTEKVVTDLEGYKDALSKTQDGLSDEAKSTVAGLIQKKNNLIEEQSTKDDSAKDIYKEKIDAINTQIQEINSTGKVIEHDELTGDKFTSPDYKPKAEEPTKLTLPREGVDEQGVPNPKESIEVPVYKIKGKEVSKEEFEKALNDKDASSILEDAEVIGDENTQEKLRVLGDTKDSGFASDNNEQAVTKPKIIVHATLNGFGLAHKEGLAEGELAQTPKDPRGFLEKEQQVEFNKGNSVISKDEVNKDGAKEITINAPMADNIGRGGGAVYDLTIPKDSKATAESIKEIIQDNHKKSDKKGQDLINETTDLVREHIAEKKSTTKEQTPHALGSVDKFVERIKSGEKMTSPEDLQFYENNKTEIESLLSKEQTPSALRDVESTAKKSDADIEKRMLELQDSGLKIGTPETKEFNDLEKEMEKRERDTVFNVPLDKVNESVDALMQKEKDMPNGFGSFIEKRDARETKEVADRYLNAKELTDAELKKDFSDAVRGNPTTWYADGLKMREALKEATNRGIDTKEMLAEVTKVYEDAGYDTQTAKSVVANMLKPIFEGSQKVNEKQITDKSESLLSKEQTLPKQEVKPIEKKNTGTEIEQEFPLNKDNRQEFTTKNGRQKVKLVDGDLVVTDAKTEKEVSKPTKKKALKEYAENFDFTVGEESTEMPQGVRSDKEATDHIIETSNNPLELAIVYAKEEPTTQPLSVVEQNIADYGFRIHGKSFLRFGDRNNLTPEMKKTYIIPDHKITSAGERSSLGADTKAKEMSDYYGVEITPQDLIDFMYRFPNGVKEALKLTESETAVQAAGKFKELTGLNLNHEIAKIAIDNSFKKLEKAEQELAQLNYETEQQLQSEYEKYFNADGTPKESPNIEIKQGEKGENAEQQINQNGKEKEGEIPNQKPMEGSGKGNEFKPSTENSQPKENVGENTPPTNQKDLGSKARDMAAKLRNGDTNILPEWMKANLREGDKRSGVDINTAFAKALETFADIHDATKDFAKAVEEGFKHIKGYFDDNKIPYDENELKHNFTEQMKGKQEPTSEDTKMANAINDAHIEGKFGTEALDKVISQLQDTDTKNIYEKVKTKIQKGIINLKNVRERLMTTKMGTEEDQAALLYDLAELKGKENALQKEIINTTSESDKKALQQQLIDVQNDMLDNALANRVIGRTASNIFRLRQLWVNREMDVTDMMEQYKASKGLKDLTPEQENEIKKVHAEIKEAKAQLEKAKVELDKAAEENATLQAENEKLKELQGKSDKQKKADKKIRSKEAIDKSNERINKAKEELKNLWDDTKKTGITSKANPFLAPKMVAAISKIAGEKVYQGVVKFDQLVKDVLDEVKAVLPHFTEEDVVNHLLSTKDKNGNYIPTKTSEAYIKSKTLFDKSNKILREKVKAYEKAQKEVAIKQYDWQKDRRQDIMNNKPLKERIIDKVLRWQRFAVLSYPSTFIKLLAVVGHQLTLKPFKFGVQKLVHAFTPNSVASKQSIWGKPEWSSLGKYYSTFIRNFALSNLKEQFGGIDTKELLYGKPMMYDEFNAAKGLLDMPGRSHGYVKSFIKNPEFQYAHEQQMVYSLSKMAEFQDKLDNKNLSKTEREELQKEYDNNDVTNEEVLEKINKLSLEHGKWAILMNDNKFVEKFNKWSRDNGVSGALLKSELPVIKIPINFIGRAFATKYGLIQAIIGKGKGEMPSVLRLAIQGTKGLTEDQANLLGRTLTIGSMGASFFVLGYMLRKKIKENEDGSFEINGVHISKNLIHSPEFESVFSGANTGNGFDKEEKKDAGNWIKNFVESDIDIAKKSPFTNMLQYGFIAHTASALISRQNNDKKLTKIENAIMKKVGDITIPGFVKQPAGWLDTKDKGIHPMGTPIQRSPDGNTLERFWQTIELGLPILRTNVPKSGTGGELNLSKIPKEDLKDYTNGKQGTQITDDQYETFKTKREEETNKKIDLFKQTNAYKELTTDEAKKNAEGTLKAAITEGIKKEMFGEKKLSRKEKRMQSRLKKAKEIILNQ